jgi:nitrite reductase/ring-hydroxylating ferredoxin subunit/putative sterol carrier protein
VVAFSGDVAPGEVKTVHYFEQDIVLFRAASGALVAFQPHCPHLGAHLGGGRVDGECLRCPFHDWAFEASGRCVDVPYAPKVPPRARANTWPLLEQNGVVMIYHGASGEPPSWKPPPLDERGWTPNRSIRWELASHPQEVGENTVDCAHLRPVHHVDKTEVLEMEQRDHTMRVLLHLVASGQVIGMPDEINDVHLDVTLHGLGQIISSTHVITAGLRTRQRIHPTPIDREHIAIFAVCNTLEMPDADYTREIDDIFWQAFTSDFVRDFPIWGKKAYLERPLLAGGDGPIPAYRKWARQFYAAPASRDRAASTPDDRPGVVERILGTGRGALVSGVERLRRTRIGAVLEDRVRPNSGRAKSDEATRPRSHARRFESVGAYFESLPQRFNPQAAAELDAVFQWIFHGDPALDHFAEVKRGTIRAASGVHAAPTVTIEMSADDYLKMINGDLNGALAFSTGRGKLRGPVRLAMSMQRIFPLDRAV